MKYTQEETDFIIKKYLECKTQDERAFCIADLSAQINKSVHSIRAKLVSEGVYIPTKRVSKYTGGEPKTKEKMVFEIEQKFNFNPGELEGLEKCTKLAIISIYKKLKALKQEKN